MASAADKTTTDVPCTEEEAQWRWMRSELYADLYRGGQQPLNKDAILSTRFVPECLYPSPPFTIYAPAIIARS